MSVREAIEVDYKYDNQRLAASAQDQIQRSLERMLMVINSSQFFIIRVVNLISELRRRWYLLLCLFLLKVAQLSWGPHAFKLLLLHLYFFAVRIG